MVETLLPFLKKFYSSWCLQVAISFIFGSILILLILLEVDILEVVKGLLLCLSDKGWGLDFLVFSFNWREGILELFYFYFLTSIWVICFINLFTVLFLKSYCFLAELILSFPFSPGRLMVIDLWDYILGSSLIFWILISWIFFLELCSLISLFLALFFSSLKWVVLF